jgi:alanyl-tRNA synthetase
VPDGGGVALVAAVAKGNGLDASKLLSDAARTVGGGGGRGPDVAIAGGRDASKLDQALDQARQAVAPGGAGEPGAA